MTPSRRSWLSVALFVPLAAILLATFACLPAPVGDPEKSKIDEQITGIYRALPGPDEKSIMIFVVKPWDARTYLVTQYEVKPADAAGTGEERNLKHYKAWLTTIAGKQFITCEPMNDLTFALGGEKKGYFAVLRLDKVESGLEARMVKPDSEFVQNLTKQDEIEAAIKAHVSDAALYGDPLTFKKLGKEDADLVESTLKKFGALDPK